MRLTPNEIMKSLLVICLTFCLMVSVVDEAMAAKDKIEVGSTITKTAYA